MSKTYRVLLGPQDFSDLTSGKTVVIHPPSLSEIDGTQIEIALQDIGFDSMIALVEVHKQTFMADHVRSLAEDSHG